MQNILLQKKLFLSRNYGKLGCVSSGKIVEKQFNKI